jgi:hypothetical protein
MPGPRDPAREERARAIRRYGTEEAANWETQRPRYMREAEPLAHPGAWPSVEVLSHVDEREQQLNQRTFLAGKRTARSVEEIRRAEEAKKAG